jgi:hypothetical protein
MAGMALDLIELEVKPMLQNGNSTSGATGCKKKTPAA